MKGSAITGPVAKECVSSPVHLRYNDWASNRTTGGSLAAYRIQCRYRRISYPTTTVVACSPVLSYGYDATTPSCIPRTCTFFHLKCLCIIHHPLESGVRSVEISTSNSESSTGARRRGARSLGIRRCISIRHNSYGGRYHAIFVPYV